MRVFMAAVLCTRFLLVAPYPLTAKLRILIAMVRVAARVVTGTNPLEQLAIASAILGLKSPGVVVECGTYQGACAIIMSLACSMTGRILYIFDSFEGLPEPTSGDQSHAIIRDLQIATYEKGAWLGPLETVKANLKKYGDISVCRFVPGYFDQTLPDFKEPVAVAFCDVDLVHSLETCLRHLWPLMSGGGIFFCHEAHHHEIASLFYDRSWWSQLGFNAPGLVGAGSGIGLMPQPDGSLGSSLGYTLKNPQAKKQSLEMGAGNIVYKDTKRALID